MHTTTIAPLAAEPGEWYVELDHTPALPVPYRIGFPAWIAADRHPADPGDPEGRRWVRPRFRPEVAAAIAAWLGSVACGARTVSGNGWMVITEATVDGIPGREHRFILGIDGYYRLEWSSRVWHWFVSAPTTDDEQMHATAEKLLAARDSWTLESGEQWVSIDEPYFPALVVPESWNGFANPLFRRDVADAVVAWVNDIYRSYGDDQERAYWDGDTIVHVHPAYVDEDGYTPDRIAPHEGRYAIGGWEWCWSATDTRPTDPDPAPTTAVTARPGQEITA
ncbi:hypothetical protein [Amycolatopsis sp. H20-H5]|uniref:hypothetical protein n=1 Tax=Amycolatopsis sp. H20-H5 TaxID=3046309 RepID=UPI002DB66206|nr:hypothetical protein [Amycolatopsis sp. H20-H5]MEC3979920.1 hypothetical protein [Amycolatopsis sp. H20-H5]